MSKIGRNDPCPCGSGRKFKKCCEERGRALVAVPDPSPEMQLVIETSTGFAIRNISAAMPRGLVGAQGKEAENATHDAAAIWGLPDFVFEPAVRQRASGVRELGDGILVLGDLGVVLQVKSRESIGGDPVRERKWIDKQCRKALSQGAGTVRELRREPAPMTNLRGRTMNLDGNALRWVVAVIIDHDDPPRDVSTQLSDNAVILLRRDWDFLFEQLKSTHGVGAYLERVAGEQNILGNEPIRYYDLAGEDAEAEPGELRPELVIQGTKRLVEPMLPMAPAATQQKDEHRLFRTVLEDIASIRMSTMSEEMRIQSLADLDSLPTQHRANAGRFLLDGLAEAEGFNGPGIMWRHRRYLGDGPTQLGVGVCSHHSKEIEKVFGTWIELRHHEFTERLGLDQPVTVGVLLTPRHDGKKLWDTTLTVAKGRMELTEQQLAAYREVWRPELEVAA